MSPAERERLAEELLELRFGCHPDPDELQRRLDADPELRAVAAELESEVDDLAATLKPSENPTLKTPAPAVRSVRPPGARSDRQRRSTARRG